jgi:hypothetical protein
MLDSRHRRENWLPAIVLPDVFVVQSHVCKTSTLAGSYGGAPCRYCPDLSCLENRCITFVLMVHINWLPSVVPPHV